MKRAYGGVVFDADGKILLRKPTNEYDGYVWTLPKGGAEPGEAPEAAALREVSEETGAECEIISRIKGEFSGGTSITVYFTMRLLALHAFDRDETEAIAFCAPEDAASLISQTRNAVGRQRDLEVIRAATGLWSFGLEAPIRFKEGHGDQTK